MPSGNKTHVKKTKKKSGPIKQSKMGRPSKYTQCVVDEILNRIISGESLNRILKDDHLPSISTVFNWLTDSTKSDFLDKYNKAKELQAEYYADELIDIADDTSGDFKEKTLSNGEVVLVPDTEHIQRSRLRVETRKWAASKLLPKRYGDKQEVALATDDSIKELINLVKPTLGPPRYRK